MKGNNASFSISLDTEKEKYGVITGNPEQITNMVEDYFRGKQEKTPGLSEEIGDIWYSTRFQLAQRTTNGEWLDMLSAFYLAPTIYAIFDDTWEMIKAMY